MTQWPTYRPDIRASGMLHRKAGGSVDVLRAGANVQAPVVVVSLSICRPVAVRRRVRPSAILRQFPTTYGRLNHEWSA